MMKVGAARNQCRGCGQYFNSNTGFEAHRRGKYGVDRRCKTPEEIAAAGYRLNKDGFWTLADERPKVNEEND